MQPIHVLVHASNPLVGAFLREYLRQNEQIVVVEMSNAPEAMVVDTNLLTPAEKRVLHALIQRGTIRQAASQLLCTERTVKTHLEHVYAKLEVRNAVQAVAKAIRWGLV